MSRRLLTYAVCGCAFVPLLAMPSAAEATKPADLRVLSHTGRVLAEFRQYTGTARIRASRRADCFGEPSSRRRYRVKGATPLGVLKDARHDRSLRPLWVSDAFLDDGFGLGVCRVGAFETRGFSFWYLAHGHAAATTGASQVKLGRGEDVLWYFTSGSEAGFPAELALRAPARARPRDAFTVRVVRFSSDGARGPAAGVRVTHGLGPTDADGRTRVRIPREGRTWLRARGGAEDVPSNRVAVCVNDRLRACPKAHGKRIFGSRKRDRIRGTRGPDRIKARRGRDRVSIRNGGEDRVNCGKGRDRVVLRKRDRDDRLRRCERVIRR